MDSYSSRSALVSLLLVLCGLNTAQALSLVTEDLPPWNMLEPGTGEVKGIAADKVKELMHRAGEKYTLNVYPWSRAYHSALQDKDTCLFSTTRTPDREALFQWVGPLARSVHTIFARASDTRRPKTLEELRPYVIGGYANDAVGLFLEQKGFKVKFASNDSHNIRLLTQRLIDFWAGDQSAYYLIRQSDFKGQIVPLFSYVEFELYLACSKGMDARRLERFNKVLKEMESDGTSSGIEARYK